LIPGNRKGIQQQASLHGDVLGGKDRSAHPGRPAGSADGRDAHETVPVKLRKRLWPKNGPLHDILFAAENSAIFLHFSAAKPAGAAEVHSSTFESLAGEIRPVRTIPYSHHDRLNGRMMEGSGE